VVRRSFSKEILERISFKDEIIDKYENLDLAVTAIQTALILDNRIAGMKGDWV